MNAAEAAIYPLLQARYGEEQGFALFPQVPDGTAGRKTRTADAIAVQLWRTRGIHAVGFEIKVSRTDWKKELQDPTKADSIGKHCRHWWIVAPKDIVPLEELPPAWGLLEVRNGKLYTRKKAPVLEAEPLNLDVIAGILRAAHRVDPLKEALDTAYERGRRAGTAEATERHRTTASRELSEARQLREAVQKFEAASGIPIGTNRWSAESYGHAVRFIVENANNRNFNNLETLAEQLVKTGTQIKQLSDALNPKDAAPHN